MDSKMKKAKSRPSDALEAPSAVKLRKRRRFSSADSPSKSKSTPSQSHRADPPSIALSNQVYLFFWHAYSPVMYTLYKIDIPRRLPLSPTKASQDLKPSPLRPMLTLKTGKYPDRMCCVQLGSKLYFLGGEFNITNPYIDEDVIKELKNVKRDVFPPDVYFLDLLNQHLYSDKLSSCKPMNSGKASPQAFVADGKIYVMGSTIQMNIIDKSKLKDLDLKSFLYFEFYNPEDDTWNRLSDPPIRDMNAKWVGHAVVGKTALLVAWQRGKECVYFFDLGTHQWKKYASLPSYPGNFSGRVEYVEDTVYGCYGNTIAAIAPLAAEEEEEEEEEEDEEEEEGEEEEHEEEEEIEEVQRLLKHHGLHLVSVEMGMEAICNVPPQLQSSSSLLHLGNRYFCYVKTGMPPQMNGIDHSIEDDKRQYISIVIFQALGKTYKEDATRLFSAKFLHSAHYVVNNPFPSEGFIDGFFSSESVDLDLSSTKSEIEYSVFPELILPENLVQQVPTNLAKHMYLKFMTLDGIQITSLPAERQLVTLERLSVSGNLLTCLPETIGSLRKLLHLNVSYNKLKSLPESIGSCFSLQELQADDNLIKDLPASIRNLIHLESLCLDNNKLNRLPKSIGSCYALEELHANGQFVKLESLSISGNLLTCLPETIGGLCNLLHLNVSYNKLKSLPESIGSCFSLQELQADDNLIEVLPASICNLIQLKSLCLDNNKLNQLPESIGRCFALEELHANDNLIEVLPASICNLIQLKSLCLDNNKLNRLPKSIGKCIALEELHANDNLIEDLPASICNLIHLKSLCLDNNNLNRSPLNLLNDCKALQNISLRGNPISMDQFQQMEGFQDYEAEERRSLTSKLIQM